MARWFRFLMVILIGVAGGVFYGWKVSPVEYTDTAPDTLRIDYKTDYVLMVAEIYHQEGDLAQAALRLGLLGNRGPLETMQQTILWAETHGYNDKDLELMRILYAVLQSAFPVAPVSTP